MCAKLDQENTTGKKKGNNIMDMIVTSGRKFENIRNNEQQRAKLEGEYSYVITEELSASSFFTKLKFALCLKTVTVTMNCVSCRHTGVGVGCCCIRCGDRVCSNNCGSNVVFQ